MKKLFILLILLFAFVSFAQNPNWEVAIDNVDMIAFFNSISFGLVPSAEAAVTINMVATKNLSVCFQVREIEGSNPVRYECNIVVGGDVVNETGKVVGGHSMELNLHDLPPVMKANMIDILKAAQKKLNLDAISENVETLPQIE